ncbi:helix-turn-helix domain-containing protein, partial [Nocardia farcinica]|uniref:helix-turn-helix domain-containing protein n=1 Tax=Nocardia farcinica TaxID=37329 RepID=UPI002457AB21
VAAGGGGRLLRVSAAYRRVGGPGGRSPKRGDGTGGGVCPGRPVKAATVGGVGVLLATTLDATGFPPDTLAGLGTAAELGRAWWEARTALRFATARRPVVDFGDLGSLALLAQVRRDALRDNADVAAVAAIAADRDALDTLDAYCATGSVRRAADLLHLHHSSVARRVEALGRGLGIDLTEPTGLLRARLALAAWRLLAD